MQHPAWRKTRGRVLDAVLAIAVAAIALAGSLGEESPKQHVTVSQLRFLQAHQPHFAYSLVVAAGLALFWRRRWPLAVLALTVVLTAAYAAAGFVPGAALVAVDIALYSVARSEPRTTAVAAGAVTAVTLFVASGLGGPFGWLGGTNTVMVVCVIAAVAIGMAVAARHQVFVTMQERAERAERDREDEARRRVDAERLRIARELHDVVAHTMSMINIQAGVAAHVLDERPEQAAQALSAIKEASREGLRELRAVLNVLRKVEESEDTAPAPRLDQLTALVDATNQAGIRTSIQFEGPRPASLPSGIELAAYRIVQESLTNVLRHAGPGACASVTVSFQPGRLVLDVIDDGKPALVTAGSGAGAGAGAGIPGMRERAAAFGGTVSAGPRDVGGWRVRAVLEVQGDGDHVGMSGTR
jgi:signal transduction histidine kinase